MGRGLSDLQHTHTNTHSNTHTHTNIHRFFQLPSSHSLALFPLSRQPASQPADTKTSILSKLGTPAAFSCNVQVTKETKQSLKRHVMSRHDLVAAWNHAEDVVAVSPLTTNVCITRHETFSCKQQHIVMCQQFVKSLPAMSLGEMVGQGEVGLYTQRVKIAWASSGGSRNLERGVQPRAHPKIFGLPRPLPVTLMHL